MLTKLIIRNFKKFDEVDIDLAKSVVFIGPNNSGKTTALQALALWDIGRRAWMAKRGGKASPEKRPGVTINRRDVTSIPVPSADLLWRDLHVRNTARMADSPAGAKPKTATTNVRIDIAVEGLANGEPWDCGFEFDYSNEESFYCRPLRLPGHGTVKVGQAKFSEVPEEAGAISVAFLPPMSGLAEREFIKQPGEINALIGQGQTAEVLRNMCYRVSNDPENGWKQLVEQIKSLFGVDLLDPQYVAERSEIVMAYEQNGTRLDLSSSGRGLQQTLLLLAHLYANPGTVLLLDEPDAHLEILRQRQTYHLLSKVAEQQGSQIVAASHSEVVLNEAAGRGKVVAFVGRPHTINDKRSQVIKSLMEIGWEQYYQAEEKGWLVCLEGSTDLAILQAFAKTLEHPAADHLAQPFVHYVATNIPQRARDVFFGLQEAVPQLVGIAIFDRLDKQLQNHAQFTELMWDRRELENYFCCEDVLLRWAASAPADHLFGAAQNTKWLAAMRESIREVSALLEVDDKEPWSPEVKATDEVLDRIFRVFFRKLNLPITFSKSDYHVLASLLPADDIDQDIVGKLDAIVAMAARARPRED